MKRGGFKPKAYERAPAAPLKPLVKPVREAVISDSATPIVKASAHRDQRIRDSARGEHCLIRLPGCPGGTDRTIWSHHRGSAGGKGMGLKAHDICGCYGCTYCDAIYDGQAPRPAGMSADDVKLAWFEAHMRSLGRLHEKGLL